MKKIKPEFKFLIFLLIFCISLFFYIRYRDNAINKDGVFVLAQIYSRTKIKNGMSYACLYFFQKKKYEMTFSDIGLSVKVRDCIFIKISSAKPELYNVLDFLKYDVPTCLNLNSVPINGWVEIPKDNCK